MTTSIYVGNIPYSLSEDSLKEVFSEFGTVISTRIITDRSTGKSKGFAFVEMSTIEEADAAIKALDNGELDGRNIRVNLAKPKENSKSRVERPRKFSKFGDKKGGFRKH